MAYGNPTPIGEVRSREPVTLTREIPHIVRFGGAVVTDLDTATEVELHGPVDMRRHGLVFMDILDPATGVPKPIEVLRLLVVEEDYAPVSKPLNIASRKLVESLRADLESGAYLTTVYTLIARGAAPSTRFEIHRAPAADVQPGPSLGREGPPRSLGPGA